MFLKNHQSPIPNTTPPLDYLEKHVTKAHDGGHWFWVERKGKRVHDSFGQAVVIWNVPGTYKTYFVSRGRYNVARLFIEAQQGPIPPRTSIASLCGLPQCVNPHHWGRQERAPSLQYMHVAGGWRVVRARDAAPIDVGLVLRSRTLDGIVHVTRVEPGQLYPALCGAPIDPATSVIVESMVTCKAGC